MKFSGKIMKGKLVYDHPHFYNAYLTKHEGKEVSIEIRKPPDGMSRKAMNYYYGVICTSCSEGFKNLGYDYDKEACHRWLKSQLLVDEVDIGEEVTLVPKSITELDSEDAVWYLDACCRLILTTFNIDVPRPYEAGINGPIKL